MYLMDGEALDDLSQRRDIGRQRGQGPGMSADAVIGPGRA